MVSAFACYRDAVIALESFDNESEIAMESSLDRDMDTIAKYLNPRLNDATGRYVSAIIAKDYDEAIKILTEIEVLAKTWKSRLSELPAESMSAAIWRTTVKVASVMVSCFILVKSPALRTYVFNWLKSHGASNFASYAGVFAVDMTVGSKAFSTIFSAVREIFTHIANKKNPDYEKYRDDPNRHNATYMAAQVGLDHWIADASKAKAAIRKLQSDSKED